MATPTPPTPITPAPANNNAGTPASVAASKQMTQDAQERIKYGQDYNKVLQEQVKLQERAVKIFDKVAAKLSAIDKTAINTRDIEKQLRKIEEERFLNSRKLADLSHANIEAAEKFRKKSEEIASLQFEQKTLSGQAKKAQASKISDAQIDLAILDKMVDTEEFALALAMQEQKLHDQTTAALLEQKEIEKDIAKQIGITGGLAQQLSSKLGLGTKVFESMVAGSRNADGSIRKLSKFETLKIGLGAVKKDLKDKLNDPLVRAGMAAAVIAAPFKLASKAIGMIGTEATKTMAGLTDVNVIQNMTSGISGMLKNIPLIGGLLGGAVDLMATFLDLTIGASSKVQKMGRELGLSAAESLKLNDSFNQFANSSSDALLNSQKMFETQIELSNQMGVMNTLSNDRLQTDIHLKEIAGLDLETRGALVESSVILGKNQKDVMNSVFAQVEGLKMATGIQLNQKAVLKEASSLGGYLGLSFAKYPAQLTKSLISIKAMGLEIKQLDSMANSFLDFESSISSQFEAQLLTGKDINLQKAREAFLNNDLAGAAQEITSQVGSSADFMKMNRIQAESMAKAFGMSRDQMGDMLKKQEYMSKIGAKDTDNAKVQYDLALKKYGTQEKMSEKLGEDTANSLMNASAQERIAGLMDKIKQGFVDLISKSGVSEFIDKAINWISQPQNIQSIISKIQGFFSTVLDVTGTVVGGIMKALNYLPGVDIDESMIDMVENAGSMLGSASTASNFAAAPSISDKSASAQTANSAQIAKSMNMPSQGTAVNLKVESNFDPLTGKSMYRVSNQDTGWKSDWQTGPIGK